MPANLTPSLARAALQAKALARRNQTARNVVLLVAVLAGLAAGAIFLLFVPNADYYETVFLVSTLIGSLAGWAVLQKNRTFTPRQAACPCCGYSWEIREGEHVALAERMPNWDSCPGCALPMSTETLETYAAHLGKP